MARELAERSGDTLTGAIEVALRERLERIQQDEKREGRIEWLKGVTKETSAIMNDGRTSTELFEELYDPATGLPR